MKVHCCSVHHGVQSILSQLLFHLRYLGHIFLYLCVTKGSMVHHVFCEHLHYGKLSRTVIGWHGSWAFSTFNHVLMHGNVYFNVSACVITHLQSSWWRPKCELSAFIFGLQFCLISETCICTLLLGWPEINTKVSCFQFIDLGIWLVRHQA
jgi:hypothetical protein